MVFQDPLSALDPYHAVGDQIAEVYRVHMRRLDGGPPAPVPSRSSAGSASPTRPAVPAPARASSAAARGSAP